MTPLDTTPILLPLAALGVILYVLRARRRPRATPPDTTARAAADPGIDLLEQARTDPDPVTLSRALTSVTRDGTTDELQRLARLDPARLAALGNTPALLTRAIDRSDGRTKDALSDLRARVIELQTAERLASWRAYLDHDPDTLDIYDQRIEYLASWAAPGLLPTLFADLAARDGHPRIRALRLELLGWIDEFHPDYPRPADTLHWVLDGLTSGEPQEQRSAIEALPTIAVHHRFAPDAAQAATLRERLIAFAVTDLAEDTLLAADIADALDAITALSQCDAAPLHAALADHIAAMAGTGTGDDPWPRAETACDTGCALVPPVQFAACALDHDPADPVLAGAALLALTRVTRQLRSQSRPAPDAERVTRTLLHSAPAPVLARLAAALEAEPNLTPDWSLRPENVAALQDAARRTNLSHDLSDRLARLSRRVQGLFEAHHAQTGTDLAKPPPPG